MRYLSAIPSGDDYYHKVLCYLQCSRHILVCRPTSASVVKLIGLYG